MCLRMREEGVCECDVDGVDVGKDKSKGKNMCVDVMLMVW